MKKNVIALAVAAAMTAPLAAQAEVTVSGQLQAEIVNVDGDGMRDNGLYMQDASTYAGGENSHNAGGIFISASEDLGGGLKALAKYGFNVKTDSGRGDRDAYVGLSGGFGTVLMGRMSSPYKTSTVKWDPFLATFMQARGNGGASYGALGHGSYLNNALAYANKFGPVKVVAAVAFDEASEVDSVGADTGDTTANHAMTFSVNIPVGPVEIALAYLDASDMGTSANVADPGYDAAEAKIGVKYSGGPVTVALQHETRDEGFGGAGTDGETFTYATASFAAGANTFSASYGVNTDESAVAGVADLDTTYAAIGMKHAFSKTTSAYVGYRMTDPDTAVDTDETVLGAGMRVKF